MFGHQKVGHIPVAASGSGEVIPDGFSYIITNSCRFGGTTTDDHLTRTPGSSSDRKTWTWSGWLKISKIDFPKVIFEGGDSTNRTSIFIQSDNTLQFVCVF